MTVVQPELSLVLDEDAATRVAIADDLGDTMFVEAGAGSGKTKSLVDRVVSLVTRAGVPMREIAAVTFTEKAAAELRDRIRRELEQVATGSPFGLAADGRERARAALDELDAAAVSTLHAFAQRLLSENPIEAGLPPRIQVLDDIGSQVAFEDRWTRFVDLLLDDPALERALLLALNANTSLATLRTIALACNANWDLVQERMGPEPDPPPLDAGAADRRPRRSVRARPLVHRRRGQARRRARGDGRLARATRARARRVRAAPAAHRRPAEVQRRGQAGKANWPSTCDVESVRAAVAEVREQTAKVAKDVTEGTVRRLAWEIAQFTLREADERRRTGQLEFHDLLVLARGVLRDPGHGWEVRRRLRARYTHLLLDEFQDTDPIQCDLAALLASDDPDARNRPWNEIAVDPGRLFVVGDPKQSIYRFRRADIAAFLRARSAFGAAPRHLTRNFRTARPVIEFVNEVFRDLIVAEPESQPEYVALVPDARRRPRRSRDRAPRGRAHTRIACAPTRSASGKRPTWPRRSAPPSPTVGRSHARTRTVTRPGSRAGWATSRSSSPRARRWGSSRTRSMPPASRTGPRRRRWSTAPARSATS